MTERDFAVGRLYPPLSEIKNCSIQIASKIAQEAYVDKVKKHLHSGASYLLQGFEDKCFGKFPRLIG